MERLHGGLTMMILLWMLKLLVYNEIYLISSFRIILQLDPLTRKLSNNDSRRKPECCKRRSNLRKWFEKLKNQRRRRNKNKEKRCFKANWRKPKTKSKLLRLGRQNHQWLRGLEGRKTLIHISQEAIQQMLQWLWLIIQNLQCQRRLCTKSMSVLDFWMAIQRSSIILVLARVRAKTPWMATQLRIKEIKSSGLLLLMVFRNPILDRSRHSLKLLVSQEPLHRHKPSVQEQLKSMNKMKQLKLLLRYFTTKLSLELA